MSDSNSYYDRAYNLSEDLHLTVNVEKFNDGTLKVIPGRSFNYFTSNILISKVLENVNDCHVLLLDFTYTDVIDSSGIGGLISLHKALPNTVQQVHLINLPENILKVMKICCIDKLFTIDTR